MEERCGLAVYPDFPISIGGGARRVLGADILIAEPLLARPGMYLFTLNLLISNISTLVGCRVVTRYRTVIFPFSFLSAPPPPPSPHLLEQHFIYQMPKNPDNRDLGIYHWLHHQPFFFSLLNNCCIPRYIYKTPT